MLCSEAVAVNRNAFVGEISLLKCKRWSCEICRPMNRWKVIQAAKRGQPNKMLTLTVSNKHYETQDEAARDLKRGLDALRKRIARRFGRVKVPMMIVFEAHKSGWPHMHILMRTEFISQAWLSSVWHEITGHSWSVDIRKIDPGRSAAYVSKYIGKDLQAYKGCKRWWRSMDYEVEQEEERIKVRYGASVAIIEGVTWDSYVERLRRDEFIEIVESRSGWLKFKDWHPQGDAVFRPRRPNPSPD